MLCGVYQERGICVRNHCGAEPPRDIEPSGLVTTIGWRDRASASGLVDRGMFEVAIGGDGLKDFCIDSPTAATELMDEQRRDRAEFEIGGVEVGAGLGYGRLALPSRSVFFADRDAALLFDAKRFDHPHPAIGDRPIDFRQVPVANLPARFLVNSGGRSRRATLRFV